MVIFIAFRLKYSAVLLNVQVLRILERHNFQLGLHAIITLKTSHATTSFLYSFLIIHGVSEDVK